MDITISVNSLELIAICICIFTLSRLKTRPPITIPTRIHDKTRGLWVSRLYIRSRSE